MLVVVIKIEIMTDMVEVMTSTQKMNKMRVVHETI